MTVQGVSIPDQQVDRRPRRWVLLALAGFILVLLATLLIVGSKWRHHPTAFEEYGGWSIFQANMKEGSTVYVPATDPDYYTGGSVTVRDVAPHDLAMPTGTSTAFEYFLCTPRSDQNLVGIKTAGEVRQTCDGLVPAIGATMSLHGQVLIVAVTPRRPGSVSFDGIDTSYSQGWQSGMQHIGPATRIRVTAAK